MMRLLFILLAIIWFSPVSSSGAMEGHVLDVGEGQAILLVSEGRGLLIDTGHFGMSDKLLDHLKNYSVTGIEKVILTHLDADHASNIFFIKHRYPDATVFETGHRIPFNQCLDAYRWVAEKLDSGDWQVERLVQGDTLVWHNITIRVLWPAEPAGDLLNPMSLVLHVTSGEDSWLIMGDAGLAQEEQLLRANMVPTEVDVLVVGHHGSTGATGPEFLQRVNPRYGVISTNAGNLRGYPSAEVIARLENHGVTVHRVYEQGNFSWRDGKVDQ